MYNVRGLAQVRHDRRSSVIYGLKVVLPILALALLSTIFLVARKPPEESFLPYVAQLKDRKDGADGMRSSLYTGSTKAGDAVSVKAHSVTPDATESGLLHADDLELDINYTDGRVLAIQSKGASFDEGGDAIDLEGAVHIVTSDGYDMRTERLIAQTKTGIATSPGPVTVDAPMGQLTAGAMEITRQEGDASATQMVFTQGVKLVYQRQTQKE